MFNDFDPFEDLFPPRRANTPPAAPELPPVIPPVEPPAPIEPAAPAPVETTPAPPVQSPPATPAPFTFVPGGLTGRNVRNAIGGAPGTPPPGTPAAAPVAPSAPSPMPTQVASAPGPVTGLSGTNPIQRVSDEARAILVEQILNTYMRPLQRIANPLPGHELSNQPPPPQEPRFIQRPGLSPFGNLNLTVPNPRWIVRDANNVADDPRTALLSIPRTAGHSLGTDPETLRTLAAQAYNLDRATETRVVDGVLQYYNRQHGMWANAVPGHRFLTSPTFRDFVNRTPYTIARQVGPLFPALSAGGAVTLSAGLAPWAVLAAGAGGAAGGDFVRQSMFLDIYANELARAQLNPTYDYWNMLGHAAMGPISAAGGHIANRGVSWLPRSVGQVVTHHASPGAIRWVGEQGAERGAEFIYEFLRDRYIPTGFWNHSPSTTR